MENVKVWADGFGRWHASVPLMGSASKEAVAARRAILAELRLRAPRDAKLVLRVTRERVTGHGTVIYGEQ
jgi:hypothetical protein